MPTTLYDSSTNDDKKQQASGSTLVTGTVVSNTDLLDQGKVLVRIPSLDLEVWARLVAIGAGPSAGFLYVPRTDDEVLIAMAQESPDDAYLLGGLWNTQDSPPVDDATAAPTTRVIQTGVEEGTGHRLEFDDAEQSITITSATKQQVTIDPTTIEIANSAGTLKITLDNSSQTITVKGVNVELDADASLSLKGRTVSIEANPGPMTIKATAQCAINGLPVRIN